jgi:hypothetical protein
MRFCTNVPVGTSLVIDHRIDTCIQPSLTEPEDGTKNAAVDADGVSHGWDDLQTNGDQTPVPVVDGFTHGPGTTQYVDGQRQIYQEPAAPE